MRRKSESKAELAKLMNPTQVLVNVPTSTPSLKTLLMRTPKRTLAVAESLTAGNFQARVGAISGASHFFLGGMTAYTLASKVGLLGVDHAEAGACDCVSESVARQMARGVVERFGANLGVATTGYAEPYAEQGVMVPFAWWAIAELQADGSWTETSGRVTCPGLNRVGVQLRVTDAAWEALRKYLNGEGQLAE